MSGEGATPAQREFKGPSISTAQCDPSSGRKQSMQDLHHQLLQYWHDTKRNPTLTAAQTASVQTSFRDAWPDRDRTREAQRSLLSNGIQPGSAIGAEAEQRPSIAIVDTATVTRQAAVLAASGGRQLPCPSNHGAACIDDQWS